MAQQNSQTNNIENTNFNYVSQGEFVRILSEEFCHYKLYPQTTNDNKEKKIYKMYVEPYESITATMEQDLKDGNEYKIIIYLKSKQPNTLQLKLTLPISKIFDAHYLFDVSTKKIIDESKLPYLHNYNVEKCSHQSINVNHIIKLFITSTGLRIEETLDTCIDWFEIPWENLFEETIQKMVNFLTELKKIEQRKSKNINKIF